jgi:hypothetical protein
VSARKGNLGLTELCKQLGDSINNSNSSNRITSHINHSVINKAMAAAAEEGHEALVRLCHDVWGAADVEAVNTAMVAAARNGHESIVRLSMTYGAPAFYG